MTSPETSVFYLPLPINTNNSEDLDFLRDNDINYVPVYGIHYLLSSRLVLHRSYVEYTGVMIYDLSADGMLCLTLRYPDIVKSSMHITSKVIEPLITREKSCIDIVLHTDQQWERATSSFTDSNIGISKVKDFMSKANFPTSFELYMGDPTVGDEI